MARQFTAFHPVGHALWYEHVAGINPALSRVLEGRQAPSPLKEDEVYELHARYIVARDVEVLERLQHRLRALLNDVAQTTAAAVEDTGKFEIQLEQTRSRLSGSAELEDVGSQAQGPRPGVRRC